MRRRDAESRSRSSDTRRASISPDSVTCGLTAASRGRARLSFVRHAAAGGADRLAWNANAGRLVRAERRNAVAGLPGAEQIVAVAGRKPQLRCRREPEPILIEQCTCPDGGSPTPLAVTAALACASVAPRYTLMRAPSSSSRSSGSAAPISKRSDTGTLPKSVMPLLRMRSVSVSVSNGAGSSRNLLAIVSSDPSPQLLAVELVER